MQDVIWIRDEVVLAIHSRELAEHGGLEGIRDEGRKLYLPPVISSLHLFDRMSSNQVVINLATQLVVLVTIFEFLKYCHQ